MQKGSSSYTSHVWNASMTCSRFFISRKRKFILCGGVLLCCLFALVPKSVNAYTLYDQFANGNTTSFSTYANPGCLFKSYELNSGLSLTLGGNHDNNPASCGYRYSNGSLSFFGQQFNSSGSLSGGSFRNTDLYVDGSFHGNTNTANISSSAYIHDNLFTNLIGLGVDLQSNDNSGGYQFPYSPDSNVNHAIVYFTFDFDSDYPSFRGIQPLLNTALNGNSNDTWRIYSRSDNSDITDVGNNWENFIDSVNDSIYMSCGDDIDDSIFDVPSFDITAKRDCVLAFSVPLYSQAYAWSRYGELNLTVPNYQYEFYDNSNTRLPSYAFNSIMTPKINNQKLVENSVSPAYVYSFDNIPRIQIISPSDSTEAGVLNNIRDKLNDLHAQNLVQPSNPNNLGSSAFMGWFDVFRISFIFPFSSLFNSFTNDSCVNIPIIASMVGSSETQYCTWWPSSIRNILTPVFTMISLMVITGFTIHWLSDRQTSIKEIN